MRIGIIAALPGELKPLVRGWVKVPVAHGSGIAMWQIERGGDELVAVCAGMGAPAARRAFTAAEFGGSLDMVLSVGWAGALSTDALAGQSYVVVQVIDAQTGERFASNATEGLRLVTTAQVANESEKRRLRASYGAALVDMEAAAVARLAQMRGIPMRCVKAVSDGAQATLPNLNPYIDIYGKLRMGAFLAHIAVRPHYWGPLLQLGRNSAAGAVVMARMIEKYLAEGVRT